MKKMIPFLLLFACFGACAAADWNVLDAGAKGDGATDNTAVFQKLLDEAGAAGGGVVEVPAGKYKFEGSLTIPRAVTLKGVFHAPPTDRGGTPLQLDGTVLLAYANRGKADGDPFIKLGGEMAALSGVTIHYPEWSQADVPPIPYPPAIGAKGVNDVAVLDTLIVNAYEGIHFDLTARFIVRNVFGYPSYRGLYVDGCYDIGRVENCHFWPFGVAYDPQNPYCLWVNTQGVAFEFARTDWQYVLNTFCFGYGAGYKFSKSAAGSCNGNFLGIGADSCRRAVLVEECQGPGLLITNGEFVGRWDSTDSVCLEVADTATDGKVSLTNCSFWGPIERSVWLRSPHTQFTANACQFREFDIQGNGAPCIQLDTGKAILQGNTFTHFGTHVAVGAEVKSAIIMGNQARGGLMVENNAGDRTQLVANEQSAVHWNDKTLAHYRVYVGEADDEVYLRRWFGPEKSPGWADHAGCARWSQGESTLRLPVLPGTPYTISIDADIPAAAMSPESGLFLGDKLIAALPAQPGLGKITGEIPPVAEAAVVLSLRVKAWKPSETMPGSGDHRNLGIMAHAITMKSTGAGEDLYNGNTGMPEAR